jgi:hypothetical protein
MLAFGVQPPSDPVEAGLDNDCAILTAATTHGFSSIPSTPNRNCVLRRVPDCGGIVGSTRNGCALAWLAGSREGYECADRV